MTFWQFIMIHVLKPTPCIHSPLCLNTLYAFLHHEGDFVEFIYFRIFVYVLDLKLYLTDLFAFWSGTFLSDLWVSSVTLSPSYTSLFSGLWPCGQAANFSIFPPLPISTPPVLLLSFVISQCSFQRAPRWQLSMLLPLGLATSFLWQPQGLPSLGLFQHLPMWEVSSPTLSRGFLLLWLWVMGFSSISCQKLMLHFIPTVF